MSLKELSIIIVNYNGARFLKACLDSIYVSTIGIDLEIICIDNASTDDSISFLKTYYDQVILIENRHNYGFAKANNKAVSQARGKYILLLNNDTIIQHHIGDAISALKQNDVGVVGIQMLDKDHNYLPSVGRFPTPIRLLKLSLLEDIRLAFKSGNFDKNSYKVDWVSGAFLLTTKELWDTVKGLDTSFFMYVEDVDFCKRITDLRKKVVFLPEIAFVHFVGFNSSREIKLLEGYKLYARKHFNFLNSILAQLSLTINYAYKRVFKNIR